VFAFCYPAAQAGRLVRRELLYSCSSVALSVPRVRAELAGMGWKQELLPQTPVRISDGCAGGGIPTGDDGVLHPP